MSILESKIVTEGFKSEDYFATNEKLSGGGPNPVVKFQLKPGTTSIFPDCIARKNVPVPELEGAHYSREYKILEECNHHPNILKLYCWEVVKSEDFTYLRLYTELCHQNLKIFVVENVLTISDVKMLSLQLLEGCQYLHDKNIAHRDIKPQNVLVIKGDCPSAATLKLADFGLARHLPSASERDTSFTVCGTRQYASPEIIAAFENEGSARSTSAFATDIFSLGLIIFEMIAKRRPLSPEELRTKSPATANMRVAVVVKSTIMHPDISEGLIGMLQWDPQLRPSSKDAQIYFCTNPLLELHLLEALQGKIFNEFETLTTIENTIRTFMALTGPLESIKESTLTMTKNEREVKVVQHSITYCMSCMFTCYDPSPVGDDGRVEGASGRCSQCLGRYPWKIHRKEKRMYVYTAVASDKKIVDLMDRYGIASTDNQGQAKVLEQLLDDYMGKKEQLFADIQEACDAVHRLEDILLEESLLTSEDYIDRLIDSESRSSRPNLEKKLLQLGYFKERARLQELAKGNADVVIKKMGVFEQDVLCSIERLQ